ncbi:hypothetical protein HBNXHr_2556 [Halorhabdus sp. BNX81]|nr:hypothetical protein HBNXHr_2556 [Halorhabdus sp. BNX81]
MDYEFTVAGDIIEPHYFIEDNDNVWGNQVYGHMEDGGEDRYGALGYIHEVEVSDPQTNMSGGIQVTFDPDN